MEANTMAEKRFFGLKNWLNFIQSFNHLLFPETCLICQDELSVSSISDIFIALFIKLWFIRISIKIL